MAAIIGFSVIGCNNCAHQKLSLEESIKQSYAMCVDGDYDIDRRCLTESIENYSKAVRKLFSYNYTADGTVVDSGWSSGLVLPGGYVLTSAHIVKNLDLEKVVGELSSEVNINLHENSYSELDLVSIDYEHDLAVLKLKPGEGLALSIYTGGFGYGDDLRVGDFTYLVGNSGNLGINVREGIVSQTGKGFMIGISNGANPGDSGGPVFAIHDGVIKVVGVLSTSVLGANDLGYMVPIDFAKDLF